MTEQWQELKETIIEMRDNDGTGTQQEVCKFLVNYMGVLEKQSNDAISRQNIIDIYKSCADMLSDEELKGADLVMEWVNNAPPVTLKSIECDDAISRDAALEKMADYVASGYAESAEDFLGYSRIICQLPSVTQKSGHWISVYQGDEIINYRCSECEFGNTFGKSTYRMKYCPNCGCRMVEPQESEEACI